MNISLNRRRLREHREDEEYADMVAAREVAQNAALAAADDAAQFAVQLIGQRPRRHHGRRGRRH